MLALGKLYAVCLRQCCAHIFCKAAYLRIGRFIRQEFPCNLPSETDPANGNVHMQNKVLERICRHAVCMPAENILQKYRQLLNILA